MQLSADVSRNARQIPPLQVNEGGQPELQVEQSAPGPRLKGRHAAARSTDVRARDCAVRTKLLAVVLQHNSAT